MICPECEGNGFVQIPSMWESKSPFTNMVEINCPTCEGQGEISDTPAKHCPACGEPIGEDKEWCAEHQGAASVGDRTLTPSPGHAPANAEVLRRLGDGMAWDRAIA